MKRAFVMLAGPGMIGKSTVASKLAEANRDISILTSDELMHKLFAIVQIPNPIEAAINKDEDWLSRVNERVDANQLIRLLHRDSVTRFGYCRIVLAEGYVYMRQWYRDQVVNGLNQLPQTTEFRLLKYHPSMDIQISRRAQKYGSLGWQPESEAFHRRELESEWTKFDDTNGEVAHYEEVDDNNIETVLSRIAATLQLT